MAAAGGVYDPQLNQHGGIFSPGWDGDRGARVAVLAAHAGTSDYTYAELAAQFGGNCAPSTARRWVKTYEATGAIGPAPRGRPAGSGALLGQPELVLLYLLVHREPMLTEKEYKEVMFVRYGVEASQSTVGRALRSLDLTPKKRLKIHKDRFSPANILRIHAFLSVRCMLPVDRIVALDEFGFHTGQLARTMGRAPKGERLNVEGMRDNEGARCAARCTGAHSFRAHAPDSGGRAGGTASPL